MPAWAGDEGVDNEPYETFKNLRFRHYAPTPAGVREIYSKGSSRITNGAFACCLKLTDRELFAMKYQIYDLLRRDTGIIATTDITALVDMGGKSEVLKVICRRGEMQKYWHLSVGKVTDPLLARLKSVMVAKHPTIFREPEGDTACDRDELLDEHGRYDMAPHFYRRAFLDRMFHQCMGEMKKHPLWRKKTTETQRAQKINWGPKGPNEDFAAALTTPHRAPAQKRHAKMRFLKNRYISVFDATTDGEKVVNYHLLDLVVGEDPDLGTQDVEVTELRLELLWDRLEGDGMMEHGHHLRWQHNGFDYYVTMESRFQMVAKEYKSMWRTSDDPSKDGFELYWEKGPIPPGRDNVEDWEAFK